MSSISSMCPYKPGQLLKIVHTGNQYEGLFAVFKSYSNDTDQIYVELVSSPDMGIVNGNARYFEPGIANNE